MARFAIIENGTVINVVEADESFAQSQGWIPAQDAVIGSGYSGGAFTPPVPKMPTLEEYDAALTAHLDSVAKARNWQDRISLMSRAGFPGPWQAEAIAFGQWADGCNVIGYQMLADFQAGNIPQPTIAEVLAALPPMVWPS